MFEVYYVNVHEETVTAMPIGEFLDLFNCDLVDSIACYVFEDRNDAEDKLEEILNC